MEIKNQKAVLVFHPIKSELESITSALYKEGYVVRACSSEVEASTAITSRLDYDLGIFHARCGDVQREYLTRLSKSKKRDVPVIIYTEFDLKIPIADRVVIRPINIMPFVREYLSH